jgi:hypothetical protein
MGKKSPGHPATMMAGDWMGQAEKKVHSLNGEPKLLSV